MSTPTPDPTMPFSDLTDAERAEIDADVLADLQGDAAKSVIKSEVDAAMPKSSPKPEPSIPALGGTDTGTPTPDPTQSGTPSTPPLTDPGNPGDGSGLTGTASPTPPSTDPNAPTPPTGSTGAGTSDPASPGQTPPTQPSDTPSGPGDTSGTPSTGTTPPPPVTPQPNIPPDPNGGTTAGGGSVSTPWQPGQPVLTQPTDDERAAAFGVIQGLVQTMQNDAAAASMLIHDNVTLGAIKQGPWNLFAVSPPEAPGQTVVIGTTMPVPQPSTTIADNQGSVPGNGIVPLPGVAAPSDTQVTDGATGNAGNDGGKAGPDQASTQMTQS